MTLPVFPSNLPGIDWNWTRSPLWSTRSLVARSGKNYRAADWMNGLYKWSGVYQFLRSDNINAEFQTLVGFINSMQGQFGNFLFTDSDDSSVTLQGLGAGDGTTTVFPLLRAFGGNVQGGMVLNSLTAVYFNGVLQSASNYHAVQVGNYGLDSISFNSAPGNGVNITATFSYYWPCNFQQDDPEFGNFLNKFWELKKLDLQMVK